MKALCHQHICKMYQVIETDTKFFMILEVSMLRNNAEYFLDLKIRKNRHMIGLVTDAFN